MAFSSLLYRVGTRLFWWIFTVHFIAGIHAVAVGVFPAGVGMNRAVLSSYILVTTGR